MSTRTRKKTLASLTLLNANERNYPKHPGEARLEAFENRYRNRRYWITLDCPEFTSLCPITGQPDFGHLVIRYIPNRLCIESKSLKLYLFSFRNEGSFHEEVVNRIADDIVRAIKPRQLTIRGDFRPRGGIAISVEVTRPAP